MKFLSVPDRVIPIPKIIVFWVLCLSVFFAVQAASSDIPARPNPPRLVNDFAGFLSTDQQNWLEQKLDRINDSTSVQIAVVTMKSLHGYDVNDMGVRIIHNWGIGQKGKDNGILILIKPKTSEEKGKVGIITGYGVESLVTDALSKRIVEYELIPAFQKNQNLEGIDKAVNVIYALTRGEFTPNQYLAKHKQHKNTGHFPIVVIIILIMLVLSFLGRSSNQSGGVSTGSGLPFWLLLGSLMGSQSQGGAWGNFNSGSGDFGGGGFGGFGGGDSGGGGASGSW